MSPYKVIINQNNEETVLSACIAACEDGYIITLRYEADLKYSLLCARGRGCTVGIYRVYKVGEGYSVVRGYPSDMIYPVSTGVASLQSCRVVAIQDYCTYNEIEVIKIMK